jgi:hypothetical protein
MKRFDRAMYAFFLLALLADVARAHASISIGSDPGSSLILNAASRLGSTGEAALPAKPYLRRVDGVSPKIGRRERFRLVLSNWSRNLSDFSSFSVQPASAPALASASGSTEGLPSPPEPISHGLYDHIGSPAP